MQPHAVLLNDVPKGFLPTPPLLLKNATAGTLTREFQRWIAVPFQFLSGNRDTHPKLLHVSKVSHGFGEIRIPVIGGVRTSSTPTTVGLEPLVIRSEASCCSRLRRSASRKIVGFGGGKRP